MAMLIAFHRLVPVPDRVDQERVDQERVDQERGAVDRVCHLSLVRPITRTWPLPAGMRASSRSWPDEGQMGPPCPYYRSI